MGIREDLARDDARFISLNDTLALLSAKHAVSLEEAARWLSRRLYACIDTAPGWYWLDKMNGPFPCEPHETAVTGITLRAVAYSQYTPLPDGAGADIPDLYVFGFLREDLFCFLREHEAIETASLGDDKLTQARATIKAQTADLDCLRTELATTNAELAALKSAQTPAGGDLSARERTSLLNTIGALLVLLKAESSTSTSDAAVIRELVNNYGEDRPGISKSGLEARFAEAKRTLGQ